MCRLAADANPRNNGLGLINAINKGCQHYLSDEDYDTTTRYLSALDALNVAKLKFAQLCCDAQSAERTPPASLSLTSPALPATRFLESLQSAVLPLSPSCLDRKRKRAESPAQE
jgi:hypothetical protein